MKKLYPISILRDELRKAHLPSSRPTLLSYEKKGVILKPEHTLVRPDGMRTSDRIYTWEEIVENIQRVKNHQGGFLEQRKNIDVLD